MDTRESQRDKRVREVINGKPSGGGDSPAASAMRAREEIQGIEAERGANLERQKILATSRSREMNTMRQAALMSAAATASPRTQALSRQVASMNPGTQEILQKYGVKPGQRTVSSTSSQTIGPNHIVTNNNTRNEIKIVQPQIPMRQQQVQVEKQGAGNLDKIKAWLDSSFAKQANEYEVQQKEYRKREWNLARNSQKLFQKLAESTKSLGEKMDPRNMGSTFGGQMKTLLFLFLTTTITKWWNPLMKRIASIEAGFRAVFGLPIDADLAKGGAKGISFIDKIKEFIGIDTSSAKGKATSLLGGIYDIFSDGIERLIDTLKLFIEDRRLAIQKINLPDFNVSTPDLNPLGSMINSAFKGVMAPAVEYLGNILSALMGGSSAVVRKASNSVISTAKNNFKHSYGGRYFTSESTDFMGNLKDDSTYGMSEMLSKNLSTKDNILRTGELMTGLKMLEGNAKKSGGAVINPDLLSQLGIGPEFVTRMIQSGKAQYVPYKIIMVPKSQAESEEYSNGSWGSYVGREMLSDASVGLFGGTMTGNEGLGRKIFRGVTNVARLPGKLISAVAPGLGNIVGATVNSPLATLEGTVSYLSANSGNSNVVAKAVPESDPRPGTPIRLLKITPEGFNAIKSEYKFDNFDPTDRNFRTWIEGRERNQKAIMGVREKLVYGNPAEMEALDKGYIVNAEYNTKLDEIKNRPGAWKNLTDRQTENISNVKTWVASKVNVMASKVSGNPTYERRNTIQNLYLNLKAALDKARPDLPEDKREVYARLMAAQAMHESSGNYAGGVSQLAAEANNYGGVTAPGGKGVGGRPTYHLDNKKGISEWTKFKDMADWAECQVGMLGGKRYNIFDNDPGDYVHLLKQGGYFGDGDEMEYANKVEDHLGTVNSVLGSYQYSSFTPTAAMNNVTPPPTGAINLGKDLSGNNIKGCSPESVENKKLKAILAARETGRYYSTKYGWQDLGWKQYKHQCTAGPSTFYEAGGYKIRKQWWNTGSPYTATSVRLGSQGLKKIWNGDLKAIDALGTSHLKPGDIGVLYGRHKSGSPSAHGMMWDGKHWVSDTVQDHGAIYSSGRLGNQSAQVWRMPEFWPDDFGGGDEDESSASSSWMDSNGEVFEGTFMGEIGVKAGAIMGNFSMNTIESTRSQEQTTSGYNPASLSASQKATIEWMKKNGAIVDGSGIYVEDKENNTRLYLDPNSGISATGNISDSNVIVVAHMGKNGTIDHYETDQEAADAYKDRALGKLLSIKISEGKTPGSIPVDIYLGEFTDYDDFSERAKKYIINYLAGKMRYTLYEVLDDGTGISSILVPRIPLLDEKGTPLYSNSKRNPNNEGRTYEYQFGSGDLGVIKNGGENHQYEHRGLRQGWTYLFKKSGFKYKTFASDTEETLHDFHPYLHDNLKIGITPSATRLIHGIMSYIRGELDKKGLKEDLDFELPQDKEEKLKSARDKILEVGTERTKEAMLGTDKPEEQKKIIQESIENWKSGKNKENYVTYINDDGSSYVIDKTLGIKIAESSAKGADMVTLSEEKILGQTGEDFNTYLRQADLVQGKLQVDLESLYKRYMEGSMKDLSDSKIRKEFIRRINGVQAAETVRDRAGIEWTQEVDKDGNIRYKYNYSPKDQSVLDNNDKASSILKNEFGLTTENALGLQKKLWDEGLTAAEFNRIFGGKVRENGPNWSNLKDVAEYYKNFGDIDNISRIWRGAKVNASLKDSWLKENSENRAFAESLIKKYNEERHGADSEDLYESNGHLIYKDDLGMVHAVGRVINGEEEGRVAESYGNNVEGAEDYARMNEAFRELNLGTESGQAMMEAEYASRFGAKSLGGGLMYFDDGNGNRVLFNVNSVKDGADINTILNNKDTKFYKKSGSSSEAAKNLFGEEDSGWKEQRNYVVDVSGSSISTMIPMTPLRYHKEHNDADESRSALYGAMESAEKERMDESTKFQQFSDAYKTARENLVIERLNKIEHGNTSEKMEGHMGNIEDYTKRSADYLEIIADATSTSADRDDLVEEVKKLSSRELPISQLERQFYGSVTKDMVNQKTEEANKKSKEYAVDYLSSNINDNTDFSEAKKNGWKQDWAMENPFFKEMTFQSYQEALDKDKKKDVVLEKEKEEVANIEKANAISTKENLETEGEMLKIKCDTIEKDLKISEAYSNLVPTVQANIEVQERLCTYLDKYFEKMEKSGLDPFHPFVVAAGGGGGNSQQQQITIKNDYHYGATPKIDLYPTKK